MSSFVMISVESLIEFTETFGDLDFMKKSFSENFFESFTVFLIQRGIDFFLIFLTILPFDATSLPPTKTFLGLILVKSSKTKMSASFPGAIPPRSFPML